MPELRFHHRVQLSRRILLVLGVSCVLAACRKDEPIAKPTATFASLHLNVQFQVDGQLLQFDSLRYVNASGNPYSVEKLQCYLSGFKLWKAGTVFASRPDRIVYLDAARRDGNGFYLEELPLGEADSISFFIGLDVTHNKTDALPVNPENINMAWPDAMGGGYHFLKLEGHFTDTSGKRFGYAMHLGGSLGPVEAGVKKNIQLGEGHNHALLQMNLNEWFRNPALYDFNKDGNYSMGDMKAMEKLRNNGGDVFGED